MCCHTQSPGAPWRFCNLRAQRWLWCSPVLHCEAADVQNLDPGLSFTSEAFLFSAWASGNGDSFTLHCCQVKVIAGTYFETVQRSSSVPLELRLPLGTASGWVHIAVVLLRCPFSLSSHALPTSPRPLLMDKQCCNVASSSECCLNWVSYQTSTVELLASLLWADLQANAQQGWQPQQRNQQHRSEASWGCVVSEHCLPELQVCFPLCGAPLGHPK